MHLSQIVKCICIKLQNVWFDIDECIGPILPNVFVFSVFLAAPAALYLPD